MSESFEGRCTCGHVRYRMTSRPMFVHCCHCTWYYDRKLLWPAESLARREALLSQMK